MATTQQANKCMKWFACGVVVITQESRANVFESLSRRTILYSQFVQCILLIYSENMADSLRIFVAICFTHVSD